MGVNVALEVARHTFAPLELSREDQIGDDNMQLEGIVFDMDGTLCVFTALGPITRSQH